MAKRKIMTRGEEPLVLHVAQLKRCCMEENVLGARVATSSADDSGRVQETSCCSSNSSESGLEQERVGNVDLVHKIHVGSVEEVETITSELDDGYRRDTSSSSRSSSSEMESPEKKLPPPKTPPADEMEKFFTTVEKQQQKYYTEKYNYDFEKDVPLEGRYEWVLIKP